MYHLKKLKKINEYDSLFLTIFNLLFGATFLLAALSAVCYRIPFVESKYSLQINVFHKTKFYNLKVCNYHPIFIPSIINWNLSTAYSSVEAKFHDSILRA